MQHFLSPSGEVVEVSPDQAAALAGAEDWSPASPQQIHDYETQRKYGTPGQQAITAMEGAARGVSLGLSSVAERALGVSPEGMSGREEANPIIFGGSELATTAGALLLSGGAGAAAKGGLRGAAELSGPALISRLGTGVAARAARLLPEAEGLAGRMAVRGLEHAAGAATEGAAYGLGNVVHEAALGDPNLTAQSAIAQVGLSSALMGGLGFLGGAAQPALGRAVERARSAFEDVSSKLQGALPTQEKLASAVSEQHSAIEDAVRKANAKFRPEEIDNLLDYTPPSSSEERDAAQAPWLHRAAQTRLELAQEALIKAQSEASQAPAAVVTTRPGTHRVEIPNVGEITAEQASAAIASSGSADTARELGGLAQQLGVSPDKLHIMNYVSVAPEQQGKGVGTELYARLMRELGDGTLVSDIQESTSAEAAKIWQKLKPYADRWETGEGVFGGTKKRWYAASGLRDAPELMSAARGPLAAAEREVAEATSAVEAAAKKVEAVKTRPPDPHYVQAAKSAYADTVDEVSRLAEQMRAETELYPPRFARRMEEEASALVRDTGHMTTPSAAYKRLDDLKGRMDALIKFDKLPSEESMEAINALKGVRRSLRSTLEDESVWGAAGARQAGYNEALSEYLSSKKNFEKYFTTKHAGVGGPVRRINPSALRSLSEAETPATMLRRQAFDAHQEASRKLLGEIEQSAQHVPAGGFDRGAMAGLVDKTGEVLQSTRRAAALQQTAAGLAGAGHWAGIALGGPAGGALAGGLHALALGAKHLPRAAEVLAQLAKHNELITGHVERTVSALARGVTKASQIGRAALSEELGHQRRATQLQRLDDPAALQEALADHVADLQEHAPAVAQGLQITSARTVAFLKMKLPGVRKLGPLGPTLKTSPAQRAKFGRYWEAAMKPSSVLRHAAAGTLAPEHMEALRACHPQLAQHIAQTALMRAVRAPRMPYQARLTVARLVGSDVDGSLNPARMQLSQAAYRTASAQQPKGEGIVRPTQGGAGKVSLAQRAMTPMDASSTRER